MNRRDLLTLLCGAAALWPLSVSAQRDGKDRVVGFLSSRSAKDSVSVEAAFRNGLGEASPTGNVRLEHRWADGHFDRLPSLAKELVNARVSVIAAVGGEISALAAKAATSTIPIVYVGGGDPTTVGLVHSLARPEANITGVTLFSAVIEQKRFELLRELVPQGHVFAALLHPQGIFDEERRVRIQKAAESLNLEVRLIDATSPKDIDAAFSRLGEENVAALLVSTDPFLSTHRKQIIALAMRRGIPAIYDSRVQVAEGGLVSYGTDYHETYKQAGLYVGRILNGARPADLPVLLPTKFELVFNITSARALGITVPPTLLARADEVIE